jgi:hypothetical protein
MKGTSLLVAMALTAGAGLARADTKSDFDKSYDFQKLRTFDFKEQRRPVKDPQGRNDLWSRRIKAELVTDFTKDGFEPNQTGQPDFFVAYYMGTREKEDTRFVGYGFPGGWGWRRWHWGWPADVDVWSIPYTESTLVVDIIDARTNQLVWRGFDSDNIDINKADKTIAKAVDNLVKRFMKETREG